MAADITAYTDDTYADTYHATWIGRDAWAAETVANKTKYLKMATRAIDRLSFAGEKAVAAQELQFPRGTDTTVPDDIQQACSEIAWSLFDGEDAESEQQDLRVVSQGIGTARVTYAQDVFTDGVAAGILSQRAWNLLVPYLRNPHDLNISRVS